MYVEHNPVVIMDQDSIYTTASYNPYTTTLYESMSQSDRENFIKATKKEMEDHINRKHWKLIPLKYLPKG